MILHAAAYALFAFCYAVLDAGTAGLSRQNQRIAPFGDALDTEHINENWLRSMFMRLYGRPVFKLKIKLKSSAQQIFFACQVQFDWFSGG
jgi:hypothetical protein